MQPANQVQQSSIQTRIKEFNSEVTSKNSFSARRRVAKSPVLFGDCFSEDLPVLLGSQFGWCIIPFNMADQLDSSNASSNIIQYDSEQEEKLFEDSRFFEDCHAEIPEYLVSLVSIFIQLWQKIKRDYSQDLKGKIDEKLDETKAKLNLAPSILIRAPNALSTLNLEFKKIANGTFEKPKEIEPSLPLHLLSQKILEKRNEGINTVKEICAEFKISQSTYYSYCKKAQNTNSEAFKSSGRPISQNSLYDAEKEFIKLMADNPRKCYTIPLMRMKLNSRFGRLLPYNRIYRYLKKELVYSYKRNTYAAPRAFDPGQKIVRYKVSKELVDCYAQGKTLIFIDETGSDLTICAEQSWSKRGEKPYRTRPSRSQRLNIIMAITCDKVLAFQAIMGQMNENVFIDFMLKVCRKLNADDSLAKDHYTFYMDNHPSHCSNISLKILKILGFKILFSPVAYYQLNPIELLFGFIKRQLKTKLYSDTYF